MVSTTPQSKEVPVSFVLPHPREVAIPLRCVAWRLPTERLTPDKFVKLSNLNEAISRPSSTIPDLLEHYDFAHILLELLQFKVAGLHCLAMVILWLCRLMLDGLLCIVWGVWM